MRSWHRWVMSCCCYWSGHWLIVKRPGPWSRVWGHYHRWPSSEIPRRPGKEARRAGLGEVKRAWGHPRTPARGSRRPWTPLIALTSDSLPFHPEPLVLLRRLKPLWWWWGSRVLSCWPLFWYFRWLWPHARWCLQKRRCFRYHCCWPQVASKRHFAQGCRKPSFVAHIPRIKAAERYHQHLLAFKANLVCPVAERRGRQKSRLPEVWARVCGFENPECDTFLPADASCADHSSVSLCILRRPWGWSPCFAERPWRYRNTFHRKVNRVRTVLPIFIYSQSGFSFGKLVSTIDIEWWVAKTWRRDHNTATAAALLSYQISNVIQSDILRWHTLLLLYRQTRLLNVTHWSCCLGRSVPSSLMRSLILNLLRLSTKKEKKKSHEFFSFF